ncbi:MAG: DUF977 family protein [bacterium]
MRYFIFIVIGLVGIWVGYSLARRQQIEKVAEQKKQKEALDRGRQTINAKKEKNKQDILNCIQQNGRITNNDIEKLLGVSDATATNYLQELEREGKIIQQGDTGRGVFYTPKNG